MRTIRRVFWTFLLLLSTAWWLSGLDKMYRLHKWLGITALTLSVAHWLLAVLPGQLVGLGWLRRQAYSASPLRTEMPALEWLQQALRGQRGMAVMVGEWAFYLALLMMLLALVRTIPS